MQLSFMDLVAEDLKITTDQGLWWLGRKIKVRTHLGAYLQQRIYNLTDRKVEYEIRDNAANQFFCGLTIVKGVPPRRLIFGPRPRKILVLYARLV
jgi:hypothetical protein